MRFRSRGTPRGERLARHQLRIVFSIAGFGALVLLFLSYRNGVGFTNPLRDSQDVARTRPPVVSDRLMGGNPLQSDEINVVPTEASALTNNDAAQLDQTGIAAMDDSDSATISGVRMVPELLTRTIRDDVIGVTGSEHAAWYGTLELANRIPVELQSSLPEAQYQLFMDAPQSCRGQAFVLRGRLRGMSKVQLSDGTETFGIRSAFDAWVSTRDSGGEVIHVNALSADPGLPLLERTGSTAPEVELVGYFFKREGYLSAGKDRSGELALTPLFLASRVRLIPDVKVVSRAEQMNPWLMWIGLAVIGGVLLLVSQFQISDNIFRGTRSHQLALPPVRPSFEGVDAVTIQQALENMEATAHASHSAPSLL